MENSYVNGQLHMEGVRLSLIAQEVGTPVYVYSSKALEQTWRQASQAFAEADPLICLAVKANTSRAVMATLAGLGAGADIVSGGELRRALAAGIPAHKIVYSGVGKSSAEIEAALSAGIMLLNAESPDELDLVNQAAARLKLRAPLALRVNPDVDARTHPKITTGLKSNKFGVSVEDAFVQYQRAAGMEHIEIKGISCHIGSQLTESAPFTAAAERLAALVERLRAQGLELEYLDLGGGLGITYHREEPPSWQEYAQALLPVVKRLKMRLVLEPGRALVGNAGVLLTQVVLNKDNQLKKFVVVDAAMNDLARPAMYGAYHEIKPLLLKEESSPQTVDVVGPICESSDFLGKDRQLPPLERGDYLAVLSAGAYGFTMSSTYNSRPLAAEVMVREDQWQIVRPRQLPEDLSRGERLPSWLGKEAGPPCASFGALPFSKMSGAGNDFILIDNRSHGLPLDSLRQLARRLCPRGSAVGADGLIALRAGDSGFDFAWDFCNSDGSLAEMCGNGARCAARFAYDLGLAGEAMLFQTLAGPIRAWIRGQGVRVALTPPKDFYFDLELEAAGLTFRLMGANTGVPHAVVMCENLEEAPVGEWGRALRYHPHFAPAGSNVNFARLAGDLLWLRTYERGVEGETLACGTGSVAAALSLAAQRNLRSPVQVRVKSGSVLQVHFSRDRQGNFHEVMLEGPAQYVYHARLAADILAGGRD